jgi:hypothetical protein
MTAGRKPKMADRDLAEWDAEIEAEFQRAVRAAKAAGKRKRGRRHVGAPLDFIADVCRRTDGRTTLVVALLIYRRTHVCRSQTVTLPGSELAALGIDPRRKGEALTKLEAVRLVRLERARGRSTKVTLTWQPD